MLRQRICIICGRSAEVQSLCEKHFLQKQKLFDIEPFEIIVCGRCGSYYDREWKKRLILENIIKSSVEKKMKIYGKIKKIDVTWKNIGNKLKTKITAIGAIKPAKKLKEESKEIMIIVKKKTCNNCTRLSGSYHEAVLQVRGERAEKILKKIVKSASNNLYTIEENRYGYDIKFVSKSDANRVVKHLAGFNIKRSYKMAAEKKGKKLYRDFYSIR